MDDILVYEETKNEHDTIYDIRYTIYDIRYTRLRKVLETILQSGLKLNTDKCQLGKEQLVYFGHIISKARMQANPEKVQHGDGTTLQHWRVAQPDWLDKLPQKIHTTPLRRDEAND